MACVVTVDYSLNNMRLSYQGVRGRLRRRSQRLLDGHASVVRRRCPVESGPVVSATFFADVSTFNGVGFSPLRVRDGHGRRRRGGTTSTRQ
jgi:hypothetical protein